MCLTYGLSSRLGMYLAKTYLPPKLMYCVRSSCCRHKISSMRYLSMLSLDPPLTCRFPSYMLPNNDPGQGTRPARSICGKDTPVVFSTLPFWRLQPQSKMLTCTSDQQPTTNRQLYRPAIKVTSGISTAIMAGEIQWGVTPSLSQTLPNESEKRANDALFAELRAQNTYEHAAETAKRYRTTSIPPALAAIDMLRSATMLTTTTVVI